MASRLCGADIKQKCSQSGNKSGIRSEKFTCMGPLRAGESIASLNSETCTMGMVYIRELNVFPGIFSTTNLILNYSKSNTPFEMHIF